MQLHAECYESSVAKDVNTAERIRGLLIESRTIDPKRFKCAPLPYPTSFNDEIDRFVGAVQLAFGGQVHSARQHLKKINHIPMVQWFDGISQHVGDVRYELVNARQGQRKKKAHRKKRDMSMSRLRRLAERDGYRCGYCGIRVVEPAVLKKVQSVLGRDVFPSKTGGKGSSNLDYHGIWMTIGLTLDHVKPFAIDADDSDGNLVTCCWSCNFGKYDYTLEELDLAWPAQSKGVIDGWHGLRDTTMKLSR